MKKILATVMALFTLTGIFSACMKDYGSTVTYYIINESEGEIVVDAPEAEETAIEPDYLVCITQWRIPVGDTCYIAMISGDELRAPLPPHFVFGDSVRITFANDSSVTFYYDQLPYDTCRSTNNNIYYSDNWSFTADDMGYKTHIPMFYTYYTIK